MDGLTNMPSVAIIGRPNVGKSALFNRLIGRKIAIVHDQPGITRDRISAICTRGTRPFVLWDTGGILGRGETELGAQVHRAAEVASRESDLLLFVVDAKEGLSPIDEDLARLLRLPRWPDDARVIGEGEHLAAPAVLVPLQAAAQRAIPQHFLEMLVDDGRRTGRFLTRTF